MTRNVSDFVIIAIFIGVSAKLLLVLDTVSAHVGYEDVTVVHMANDGFSPKEVNIKQGETVIFENIGKNPHWPASNIHPTHAIYPESGIDKCAKEEEKKIFDACKGILTGVSYSFKFEYPGVWRYHDHLHPVLSGKIVVEEVEGYLIQNPVDEASEPRGFLGQILKFFSKLVVKIAGIFKEELKIDQNEVLMSFLPERKFDETITKDSREVFTNEDALFSYVKKFGPAETVQHLNELGLSFGDCHQKAHETGRFAYEIFGGKAFQTCSAECHSGCYHGATEAFFREHGTSDLTEELKVICSSELNPFFSHQCIHGIGHGLMAFVDYEIHEALANCDLLPGSWGSCYTGVFMENIVGGLAQDAGHLTEYLSDDPHFPCNVVAEKYRHSCYFYQTSRMVQLFVGDFAKVSEVCSKAPSIYHRPCFESMGRDVGGVYRADPQGAIAACASSPEGEPRSWCLAGAVQDTFWDSSGQDVALAFCKILTNRTEKDACYVTIFARAPQVLGSSDDLESFCAKSERQYQDECLSYIR